MTFYIIFLLSILSENIINNDTDFFNNYIPHACTNVTVALVSLHHFQICSCSMVPESFEIVIGVYIDERRAGKEFGQNQKFNLATKGSPSMNKGKFAC
jgi:hypothetical protein